MANEDGIGRPISMTPEIAARIIALIRAGNYVETAAAACGVMKPTLYDWLKRGARGDPLFADFSNTVVAALNESEAVLVNVIRKAAVGDWSAAAWILERRHPNHWGRKDYLRIDSVNSDRLIIEERRNIAKEILSDPTCFEAAATLATKIAQRQIEAGKKAYEDHHRKHDR